MMLTSKWMSVNFLVRDVYACLQEAEQGRDKEDDATADRAVAKMVVAIGKYFDRMVD